MLNVALLGAGMMGETHAKAYLHVEGCQLKYIYNRTESRGRALAELYNAEFTSDLNEIFTNPDIDIVDICLPTYVHEEIVTLAAEGKKHIICEKPFALNLEQAKNALHCVRKNGVKLMVAQVLRFWPEYKVIREVVNKGDIGKPLFARAARLSERPVWAEWFKNPNLSGGALLDLQIHDLDFLTWLFGKPEKLYSQGIRTELGAWDHVMTTLSYGNGIKAYCEGGVMMPRGYPFTMELSVTGTEGNIEFYFKASQGNVENRDLAEQSVILYKPGQQPQQLKIPQEDAYENQIRYFIEAIESGKEIDIISEEEVLTVLEITEKSKCSLESGEMIHF